MFCRNCGSVVSENDAFCTNCGTPAQGGNSQNQKVGQVSIGDSAIVKLFKNYFKKPLTFFNEVKEEDSVKLSVIMIIAFPIIYGILKILYFSVLINTIIKSISKLPSLLAEFGIISKSDLVLAQKYFLSNDYISAKNNIDTMISNIVDKKDIFFSGMLSFLAIVVTTGIILFILNAVMYKNKMNYKNTIFVSISSFFPLVIALLLASIVTSVSIIAGFFIMISGFILSCITLYSGVKQTSEESETKIFYSMGIYYIILSILFTIVINNRLDGFSLSIVKALQSIKNLF